MKRDPQQARPPDGRDLSSPKAELELLRLTRERLRLVFWAARQTLFLLVLAAAAASFIAQVASGSHGSALEQVLRLIES